MVALCIGGPEVEPGRPALHFHPVFVQGNSGGRRNFRQGKLLAGQAIESVIGSGKQGTIGQGQVAQYREAQTAQIVAGDHAAEVDGSPVVGQVRNEFFDIRPLEVQQLKIGICACIEEPLDILHFTGQIGDRKPRRLSNAVERFSCADDMNFRRKRQFRSFPQQVKLVVQGKIVERELGIERLIVPENRLQAIGTAQ